MKLLASLFLTFFVSASAQTTLNLSQDLVRLGIATANMAPNQQSQDATPLFQKGVQYAQNNRIGKVIADRGSYYFLSLGIPGCHMSVPSDLTIDLQGSDLYFADTKTTAVCAGDKNITLQNFTIDYLKLYWTQFVITSVDAARREISFTLQPGWQRPSALNGVGDFFPSLTIFRGGRLQLGFVVVQQPLTDDKLTIRGDIGLYSAPEPIAQIRPGDVAALEHNTLATGLGGGCDGCTFRNIRIYAAGLGAVFVSGQSNLFERVYVMPRPGTDRLLSAHADFHLILTGPNNTIRLSRAIRKGDDGFSPASQRFGTVMKQLDNRTVQVQGSAGVWSDGINGGPQLVNGSTVEFQRLRDGVILGRAAIVSQTAPQRVTVPHPSNPAWTTTLTQVNLTFDRDLSSDFVGSSVYSLDPNRRGGNLLLERNTVQQQVSGSAFQLYGLVNATVKGNYVSRSAWAGVWIDSNTIVNYGNIPPSTGVTVTRNVIDRPNTWLTRYTDIAQFAGIQALAWLPDWTPMRLSPMQNLTIGDNFIADPRRAGIWIGNTTGGSVSGNYLFNPNNDPSPQIIGSNRPSANVSTPLVVDASQNVTTTNNTIDRTSGRMWVTDTQYRQLAAYAPGGTLRLNAYNLGKLASPSVTLTDADGVVTAARVLTTADHALEVQVAAAAALGGAYLTLASGSAKYLGTLFVDSQDNLPAVNDCTYELSPSSTEIPASGSVSILVITEARCAYNVTASDPGVTVSGPGSGTRVVTVAARATTTVEIAGLPVTLTVTPVIQAIMDSWGYTAGIAPGTWVTIGGTNLASGAPQTWNLSGAQNLPTALGGVTVTFNGARAALYYVSATQINALVPASATPGPVQVVVQPSGMSSAAFTITATATQPAVYAPPNADGSRFFVTAALAGTGILVGNSATDPRVIRGAEPGDTLDL